MCEEVRLQRSLPRLVVASIPPSDADRRRSSRRASIGPTTLAASPTRSLNLFLVAHVARDRLGAAAGSRDAIRRCPSPSATTSLTVTSAPSSAKRTHSARPMPDAPPVTTVCCPARSIDMSSLTAAQGTCLLHCSLATGRDTRPAHARSCADVRSAAPTGYSRLTGREGWRSPCRRCGSTTWS